MTLIFHHIPKTAGSTFKHLLMANFQPERTYLYYEENIAEFEKLSLSGTKDFDLFVGHLRFGIHDQLINDCSYITFLRDPVKRMVSYYYHIKTTPQHPWHKIIEENNITLGQFSAKGLGDNNFDNLQTREIAGKKTGPRTPCSNPFYELALDNIDKYYTVGFTEYFDQSLQLFEEKLGLTFGDYQVPNRREGSIYTFESIDEEQLDQVRRNNVYDIALYERMREQFL